MSKQDYAHISVKDKILKGRKLADILKKPRSFPGKMIKRGLRPTLLAHLATQFNYCYGGQRYHKRESCHRI
ncbi:MAG: hypothetical protein ACE5DO_12310 [Desulfobacterales bacterium]